MLFLINLCLFVVQCRKLVASRILTQIIRLEGEYADYNNAPCRHGSLVNLNGVLDKYLEARLTSQRGLVHNVNILIAIFYGRHPIWFFWWLKEGDFVLFSRLQRARRNWLLQNPECSPTSSNPGHFLGPLHAAKFQRKVGLSFYFNFSDCYAISSVFTNMFNHWTYHFRLYEC